MRLTELQIHRFNILLLGRDIVPEQPAVLVEYQAAWAQLITDPQLFPMLGCGKGQKRLLFTSPNRERRIERLTMIARVMSVVGAHTDLLSLSNGKRINGRCHPITELQIGRELGLEIAGADGPAIDHDTKGMRAVRAAIRDIDDGGLISREQPKMQYCSEAEGGCGKKIPRGGTCNCGRRDKWRWRSFPTIITTSKRAFEVVGLLEALEEAQERRYEQVQAGQVGPQPEKDVRVVREQQRIVRAQALAAKRAQLEGHHDPRLVAYQKAQLDRLEKKIE